MRQTKGGVFFVLLFFFSFTYTLDRTNTQARDIF